MAKEELNLKLNAWPSSINAGENVRCIDKPPQIIEIGRLLIARERSVLKHKSLPPNHL